MPLSWGPRWFKSVLILLEDLSISIDPQGSSDVGDIVLISHAHGDHVAGFKSQGVKVCSEATAELYRAQFKKKVEARLQQLPSALSFGDLEIRLAEAGHVLGSSQFQLLHPERGCLVYTGDLNVDGSIIHSPPPVLSCDELVVDATFGHPLLKFPLRNGLYSEISKWVSKTIQEGYIPVLHAHPLGKAQEVIKVLNEYLGIEPVVHPRIARINQVYIKYGVDLAFKTLNPLYEGVRGEAYIAPISPRPLPTPFSKVKNAVVTGWALVFNFSAFDKAFPLSNHSGFPSLIEYVSSSGAKKVYTIGYYAEEMASWLRRRGVAAESMTG